jgi:hypothetical protein
MGDEIIANSTIGTPIETQYANKHKFEERIAEVRLINIKDESPDKIDRAIEKIQGIITKRKWVSQPEIIQEMCPLCDNLIRTAKNPIIFGVHCECMAKVIEAML